MSAQNVYTHKNVTRRIKVQDIFGYDKKHHLTDMTENVPLTELMVNEIRKGAMKAYADTNNTLGTEILLERIENMVKSKSDTQIAEEDAAAIIRITTFPYYLIQEYQIQENWVFNRQTGQTDIQITGIAPIYSFYGDDGISQGMKIMFWLKYNEAKPIIDKYEQYHPESTIAKQIWNDYFLSDIRPKPTN